MRRTRRQPEFHVVLDSSLLVTKVLWISNRLRSEPWLPLMADMPPTEIPDWLLDRSSKLNGVVLMEKLATYCQPLIEKAIDRGWSPSGDADPYLRRVWDCVKLHGSRFAAGTTVELGTLLDRMAAGDLGYGRSQSNILSDVCFAQALQTNENEAAKIFENDFMPILRRIAFRFAGQPGQDLIENFSAVLIMPGQNDSPPIASYKGKTSLLIWLKSVVLNHCRDKGRVGRIEKLTGSIDPAELQFNKSIPEALSVCAGILEPIFRQAVNAVPVEDKSLIKFLMIDDAPQKDVARLLGIHTANVGRRRDRVKELIWQFIQTNVQKTGVVARECLDQVLAGDDRELNRALGNILSEALPRKNFFNDEER